MEFSTQTSASVHQIKTAALAVGIFSDGELSPVADMLDRAANGALREVLKSEFQAKPGSHLVLRDLPGVSARRVVLIGLGKQAEYQAQTHAMAEQAFARYCVQARITEGVSTLAALECGQTSLADRARALAVAAGQATYHYDATLSKADADTRPKLKKLALGGITRGQSAQAQKGLAQGHAVANGMQLARTLGDLPGNICTPTYLADTARKLARSHKSLGIQVLGPKQLEALKMGAFLSVAKGSYEPPAFIVLRHTPSTKSKKAPIVLVGKGLTFDAGGISLKPAAGMDEMKYDMCGAASVLGTMQAVAELAFDREVIGVVASCENLPSGRANKPGDVVTSMSGQTIEILNTDAEGRLVLCDALTYVERFKPDTVIDIATLTGACVVALGHVNTGLFTKDDELAAQLLAAGKQANDTAWRLPLEDAYQEQLRTNFADMANIGGPPAGSVTAACFLSRYTGKYRWAHLDIAGTAWRSGKDKGASGRPVPLLVQYLLNHA
ncbi:leucyl aminopeptidase [Pusillimonas sp. CC-YST705]|uniref:Probable cytosol aminopeptidase n=1 Tax=Mesopusillimonas faecipullorum TaxID=2755040 RepID=A0ABS8C931_9BURK|nr:leucyl aminopeptidase [Mesopusillimonas faecipullorum]MCB5362541.1 leucyl aminopeptidase [Mesopusillimonas faecipullorum]